MIYPSRPVHVVQYKTVFNHTPSRLPPEQANRAHPSSKEIVISLPILDEQEFGGWIRGTEASGGDN